MRALQAALLSLLLGSSALAYGEGERPGLRLAVPSPVQAAIQEKDVALLLDYLRAAIGAAVAGREPPPPPSELERRMGELGSEIKARGTLAALLLLRTLEEEVRALLHEGGRPHPPGALPPTVPYTPVSSGP